MQKDRQIMRGIEIQYAMPKMLPMSGTSLGLLIKIKKDFCPGISKYKTNPSMHLPTKLRPRFQPLTFSFGYADYC